MQYRSDIGLRKLLLAAFVFGSVGVGAELLLMEHTEGVWQLVPVILIAVSIPLFLWQWRSRNRVAIKLFQGLMGLFALSGLLGMGLHYKGKAEFKLEINPELDGWALFWECIHGHSMPPVLAPGTMILIAMVGLACAHHRVSLVKQDLE
jgi:hypothetical protein